MPKDEGKGKSTAALLSGAAAGLINGFFGGGGGMLLVPLLIGYCKLPRQRAFATSVAIILPLCLLSALIYFLHGNLQLLRAAPYLVGGLLGGFVGGKLYKRVSMDWLRLIFVAFLLYGAWRSFV